MNKIDLNKYAKFSEELAAIDSKDLDSLIARLRELDSQNMANIPLLMTCASGIASEGGEFHEIVKKIIYQRKPLNDDTVFHMKRELGDIAWYWVNACTALGMDPNDVIAENVGKLEARYPGGTFDVHYSENRKEGDL